MINGKLLEEVCHISFGWVGHHTVWEEGADRHSEKLVGGWEEIGEVVCKAVPLSSGEDAAGTGLVSTTSERVLVTEEPVCSRRPVKLVGGLFLFEQQGRLISTDRKPC